MSRSGRTTSFLLVAVVLFVACGRSQETSHPATPATRLDPVGEWQEVQGGKWQGVSWHQFVAATSEGGTCQAVEFDPPPYESTSLSSPDAAAVDRQLAPLIYEGKNPYCREKDEATTGSLGQLLGGYQATGSKFFYVFGSISDAAAAVEIQFESGDRERASVTKGAFIALYPVDRSVASLRLTRVDGGVTTCTVSWANPRVPFSSEC